MKLSGWGRYPVINGKVNAPSSQEELAEFIKIGGVIARGNGRSYGDSSIGFKNTLQMHKFNRLLAFNEITGQLVAEAGVLLADIISILLPRGWFPMVTPGTKFVTLGGMIAADVHGKNHHCVGSMGSTVDWIDIMDSSGAVQRCSRTQNNNLFGWTLGGMGLTGIIIRAAIRLRPVETGWIKQMTICAQNIQAVMDTFEAAKDNQYVVAWIDCLSSGSSLGRSLVMLGQHSTLQELNFQQQVDRYAIKQKLRIRVPFDLPSFFLNGMIVRFFNTVYYWMGSLNFKHKFVDWNSFFYPLDSIYNWNKIYGSRGFLQFQCVIPLENSKSGLTELLNAVSISGRVSFLAVLKRFGEQSSPISFPMLGYSLALDLPVTDKNLKLLNKLDKITIRHGGRFYLAKDARMTAETLISSDKRIFAFVEQRKNTKATNLFNSFQSERLKL